MKTTNNQIALKIRIKRNGEWVSPKIEDIGFKRVADYCYAMKNEEIVVELSAHDNQVFFAGNKGPSLALMQSAGMAVLPMRALSLLNKLHPAILLAGQKDETMDLPGISIAIDEDADGYNNLPWSLQAAV